MSSSAPAPVSTCTSALQACRGPVRVGQEHLTLDSHSYRLRREIAHRYTLLDALTTVTRADADDYRGRS